MAHRGAGMPRPIAHFNAKEFKCHFEHKRHGSIPSWNLKLVNLKFGRDMGRSWDGHGTVMEWSWDCHGTVMGRLMFASLRIKNTHIFGL